MIDEKKLIEDLRNKTFGVKVSENKILLILLNCGDVFNAIFNQAKVVEWIPCKERLPEKNKTVLCWVKSTTIASGESCILGSCDNGFWFLKTYEIGHLSYPVKDYEVVAWQPLPEPYKESDVK